MPSEHILPQSAIPAQLVVEVENNRTGFTAATHCLFAGLLLAAWEDLAKLSRSFQDAGYELLAEIADSLHLLTQQMLEAWQR